MQGIGEKIKSLRKQNGLTQEDLAQALREKFNLKTDRVMVSKWETGFQTPEMYTIVCIAKAFNVSIDYLTNDDLENIPDILLDDGRFLFDKKTLEAIDERPLLKSLVLKLTKLDDDSLAAFSTLAAAALGDGQQDK